MCKLGEYIWGAGDGDQYFGLDQVGKSRVTLSSATSNCTCLNTANFPSGDDETCLGATALTFWLGSALLVVGDGVGIGGRGECVASYLHDRAYVTVGRAVWVEVLGVKVNVFNLGDIHAVVAAEV